MSFWNKHFEVKTESKGPEVKQDLVASTKAAPVVSTAIKSDSATPIAAGPQVRSPEDKLQERYSKIRSALGPGTVIQGRLSFDSVVRIDGKLSGDVFSSKPLIVGQTGQVDAQIEVASLIVLGQVKGKVKAQDRIEVWEGGRLEADVTTPIIQIEEGAIFSGECSMPGAGSTVGAKK